MRLKTEVSSGGVVYRKKGRELQILILKDPKGNWTFPKGLIEKGEDPLVCGQREIKEEVGIEKIKFKDKLGSVKYFYTFKDNLIKKTVHYFLFELIGDEKPKPQKEEGIQDVQFVSLSKANKIIGYKKTNGPILKKIEEYFKLAAKN